MKVLLAATLVALLPAAVPAAPSPAPDRTAEARVHFRKGSELYRQARYREAIAEFQAAYKIRPHGVLHFNVAQCYEKLGDIPAALASYHDYLREVPRAEDRETVQRAISNLEARLAATGVQQILVYSEPPGAEVLVDGQSRGRTPFSVVLPHGTHVVGLVKAGYETVTREVALAPDRSQQLDVVLRKVSGAHVQVPLPPPPVLAVPRPAPAHEAPPGAAATTPPAPPPEKPRLVPAAPSPLATPAPGPRPVERGKRIWTWVAAGAAVAVAGAGLYYGMQARDASAKLRDSVHTQAEAQRLHDDARSKARTANILYGVAGAAGAAGVTLFFLEGSF